jgi:hypothetical protein
MQEYKEFQVKERIMAEEKAKRVRRVLVGFLPATSSICGCLNTLKTSYRSSDPY